LIHVTGFICIASSAARTSLFLAVLFAFSSLAFAQQSYVGRFDGYVGYMYLDSPKINLGEHGFHIQTGMRMRTWYSIGFDYSRGTGKTSLTADLLPTALQQTLGAQLAQLAALGRLPAGYVLTVPLDSTTQTFTMGPQLAYRHFSWVTLFIRPALGAIREMAIPKPADPIATAIVAQLAPSGKKTDWTGFYGAGGGFDFNVSKTFSLRVQADFVYDHLFNDLLREGRRTVRFSIGPGFQFGRNMVK
jgi:hypothetical protein